MAGLREKRARLPEQSWQGRVSGPKQGDLGWGLVLMGWKDEYRPQDSCEGNQETAVETTKEQRQRPGAEPGRCRGHSGCQGGDLREEMRGGPRLNCEG